MSEKFCSKGSVTAACGHTSPVKRSASHEKSAMHLEEPRCCGFACTPGFRCQNNRRSGTRVRSGKRRHQRCHELHFQSLCSGSHRRRLLRVIWQRLAFTHARHTACHLAGRSFGYSHSGHSRSRNAEQMHRHQDDGDDASANLRVHACGAGVCGQIFQKQAGGAMPRVLTRLRFTSSSRPSPLPQTRRGLC